MAVARFQILTGSGDSPPGVIWRFLSANNRRLCQSITVFPDVDACRAAVRALRKQVDTLSVVTMRDGPRRWAWRVCSGDGDLGKSSRSYERLVEANRASTSFLDQVALVPEGQPPQVVQF
jgi:hypothetical protein